MVPLPLPGIDAPGLGVRNHTNTVPHSQPKCG